MKSLAPIGLISANLMVLLALTFAYPDLMVSPGHLSAGHAALSRDCLACHQPGRGPTTAKCVSCHAVPDIGIRTTRGVALPGRAGKPPFHQELRDADCSGCHRGHPGANANDDGRPRFQHTVLPAATLARCEGCHKPPTDPLHGGQTGSCSQCHVVAAWKPATFEHARFFVLDRDHNVSCATCHEGGNYKSYTCYGCHEHTPANMQAEHAEEGVRNLDNCVKCHRSGDKGSSGEGGSSRREGRGEGRRERDHDERP